MNESTLVQREEWESDLDWLARNVHVWPESTPHIIPVGDCVFEFGATFFENHVCLYHSEFADSKVIHKHQWLSRRAELQNKPSWGSHEFAVIAQGGNGYWYGSNVSEEKFGHEESFCITGTGWNYICDGIDLGDWRNTLEKRPEQAIADICREVTGENRHEEIFEQFVSVEDAKITIMQGDGDVKHSGGIIGRSLPLEEDAATAKQPTPKGSGNPILGMVLADLTNRALEGKEKYGEPLLAHNGRNPLWDAYQEALDLAMYLRQAIEEQK